MAQNFFQNIDKNYELVTITGSRPLQHYYFTYNTGDRRWIRGEEFTNSDPRPNPRPVMFQNIDSTNYELVTAESVDRENVHLTHYYFTYNRDRKWVKGQEFGGQEIGTGIAFGFTMFQNFDSKNYELVYTTGNSVKHYYFTYNSDRKWTEGEEFGFGFGTPSMFQNFDSKNYELVFRTGISDPQLTHWIFNYSGDRKWKKVQDFGTKIRGDPVMFQNFDSKNYELVCTTGNGVKHYYFTYNSDRKWKEGDDIGFGFGTPSKFQNFDNKNYELVVRVGEQLTHYTFNYSGDRKWAKVQDFGTRITGDPVMFQNFDNKNYELVVQEEREGEVNHLTHYIFNYGGDRKWAKGAEF